MKNLVEYILIRLVEFPDEVRVEEAEQEDGLVILTVYANEADYGRIIGKQGAVINAIRQLVKIRSIKEGKRAIVKVATEQAETN